MPKRAPTPPLLDDDADYYSVYRPYPLNFDWDIHTDVLKHVRWIAACVGIEPFYAFHYKPKAPSMVIVEIEKNNQNAKTRFLGEHRWREILRGPTLEEQERFTQVFPCFHTNNRSVVKDGWHRIAVKDDWFKGWSATQDFVEPYPPTYHCYRPTGDHTNTSLCRPIPTVIKRAPPPPAKSVVGSTTWVNAKTGTGPSTGPVLQGAWSRGRGGINLSTRTSGTNPKAPPSRWNQPTVQNNKVSSPAAWNNRPHQVSGEHSQEVSSGNTLAVVSRGPAPARPPGLPANPWKIPAPPGVMQTGPDTSVSNAMQEGSLDKQVARISLTENREGGVYTLGDGLDDEDPVDAMFIPRYEVTEAAVSAENLWPAADDTSAASVPLCPLHGRPNCKPGICREADRLRKLEQAEQRKREAEQARAFNREVGKGRGRGRGRGGSAGNNQNPSLDPWS
ncbi:hypothetical protein F5146DRAFT_1020978 [Armillaria mellea]|nr:hypothetical protein F5146DRAFT_1020978 [Armillaria mellea]